MDGPVSDLLRSKQHEPDHTWPTTVKVQLYWWVDGRPLIRTELIEADQFFGLGKYGAPMEGAALVGMIERMRRAGPPPLPLRRAIKGREKAVAKKKR